jgi:methyl-accepting chemotaxis protein
VREFFNSLKVKNSLIMIIVMVPLIVGFLAYNLERQAASMRQAITERGIILAITGSEAVSKILNDAITTGELTEEQLFDRDYQLIPNTEPKKYHTAYDYYTDKHLTKFQDSFLADEYIIYAITADINAYVPTHNTISKVGYDDNAGRSKRIFDTPVTRNRTYSEKTYLFQEYQRDSGEVIWDISAPVYVNGRHWGSFGIGFSIAETEGQIALLRNQTILGGAVLILAMIALIIYISNLISGRVKRLEQAADRLAAGDLTGSDFESMKESDDEVGRLARSLHNMAGELRRVVEGTSQANENLREHTVRLRDSMLHTADRSGVAAAKMSGLSLTMQRLETDSEEVVKAAELTLHNLRRAEETASKFSEQMKSGSRIATRAGESVRELDSQVEKIGEILAFISLIAEQASLLAEKAVQDIAEKDIEESNFSSMASEIGQRARDASNATKGMSGLFDNVRKYAAQAAATLEKDQKVVYDAYNMANELAGSLKDIVADLEHLFKIIGEVGVHAKVVGDGITTLDASVAEQEAMAQSFTEALQKMEASIQELQDNLSHLKL